MIPIDDYFNHVGPAHQVSSIRGRRVIDRERGPEWVVRGETWKNARRAAEESVLMGVEARRAAHRVDPTGRLDEPRCGDRPRVSRILRLTRDHECEPDLY